VFLRRHTSKSLKQDITTHAGNIVIVKHAMPFPVKGNLLIYRYYTCETSGSDKLIKFDHLTILLKDQKDLKVNIKIVVKHTDYKNYIV